MPDSNDLKSSLLLHVCCIGCGAYVFKVLGDQYNIRLYFYNPSIYPEEEYNKRLDESRRIAKQLKLELEAVPYNHAVWQELVKGHERDKERGPRCQICYRDRLEATAMRAKELDVEYFATTLSISPHKDAQAISRIGQEVAQKTGVKFHDQDFKKQDGFKKSCTMSHELGLYRQDYCGCEFSRR